jgi:hypothetical protein
MYIGKSGPSTGRGNIGQCQLGKNIKVGQEKKKMRKEREGKRLEKGIHEVKRVNKCKKGK